MPHTSPPYLESGAPAASPVTCPMAPAPLNLRLWFWTAGRRRGLKTSSPAVPGEQGCRRGPRNPAPDSVPQQSPQSRTGQEVSGRGGVEVIGSWRLQWAQTPSLFTSVLPLVPGRSRPLCGGPRAGGSRSQGRGRRALAAEAAEGEACWGRREYQRKACQERVGQASVRSGGPGLTDGLSVCACGCWAVCDDVSVWTCDSITWCSCQYDCVCPCTCG